MCTCCERRKRKETLLIVAHEQRLIGESHKRNRAGPLCPEIDRVELIAAMEMVDYVVVYDEPDPYNLIAAIKPNVLAKGGDWSPDKIVGADIVERHGGRVAVIPYLEGFSTSGDY